MSDLNERARLRLRDEMARRHLSQREVANLIEWSQSKVAKHLTGRTPMNLEELDALCFALGLSPVEAVRDHGLEFLAEMTPTELRILERIRQLPAPILDAVLMLLDINRTTRLHTRTARITHQAGPQRKHALDQKRMK